MLSDESRMQRPSIMPCKAGMEGAGRFARCDRRGFEWGMMAFHDAGLGLIDGSSKGRAARGLLTCRLNLPAI